MAEITSIKRKPQPEQHNYKIRGSVFELHRIASVGKDVWKDILYKRYFVSPEFIELFYKIHDGEFDDILFTRLADSEKQMMSRVCQYLDISNRDFNIALSKSMRGMFDRFRMIEGAIKAGNLNKDLHDEYVSIMQSLADQRLIPKVRATQNCKAIGRTLNAQTKSIL